MKNRTTFDDQDLRDNNKARRRFVIESTALILIVLSPFIFKLHEYVSTDPEATLDLFFFELDRNGFTSINVYTWFLLGKIVPLYLFFIWFLTCKHWWYHIILIPICMYAFQIFEAVYSEDQYIDTENLLWLLPLCMVIIPFVYFVRVKLYDKYVHGIDLEAMNAELNYYKEKEANQKFAPKRQIEDNIPAEEDLSSETPRRILSGFFRNLF